MDLSTTAGARSDFGGAEAGGLGVVHRREALLRLRHRVVPVAGLVGDHRALVALDRARLRAGVPVAGQGPGPGEPAAARAAAGRAGTGVGAGGLGARRVGADVGPLAGVRAVAVARVVAGDGIPLLDEAQARVDAVHVDVAQQSAVAV